MGSFLFLRFLLKLPIFGVQKAATPKNGVEFRQKSIGAIRCGLATSYNDVRCDIALLLTNHRFLGGGGWVVHIEFSV